MKHRENSGPKSAENLHLIVSVNEAITTVSRNEINIVRQLDASMGLSMLLQVQLTSVRKESWKNPQIALKKIK